MECCHRIRPNENAFIIGSRRNSTHTHILLYYMITFHVIIGSGRNCVSMYVCMYVYYTHVRTHMHISMCTHRCDNEHDDGGQEEGAIPNILLHVCVCVACVCVCGMCVCRLCVYILCTRLTQSHTSTRTTTGAAKDLCAGVQLLPRNHLADIPH